jgi:XTP/dITP diphosphohydrolase
MAERHLVVATTNAGKVAEVQLALAGLSGWIAEPLPSGLPEIEETGTTFLENAILKATHYSRFVEGLALADDSGLCVQALDGRPGVFTDRYGPSPEARNHRVLAELQNKGESNRNAEFHCAFAIARSGSMVWTTEGRLDGEIATAPAGKNGFGFDPIFFVPTLRKTLAELTSLEKNQVSARGQALMELRRFLAQF